MLALELPVLCMKNHDGEKSEEGGKGDRKYPSPVTRELVTVTPYVPPNPGPYPQVGDL